MVQDLFVSIIDDLGKLINIPLKVDKNNACVIKYPNDLNIQIEYDATSARILFAAELGELPPGRFREDLFREALKANGLPAPRIGIFAYSKKIDNLVLYDKMQLENTSAQHVAEFLQPFFQKAELWKTCIARNEIPSFTSNELSFGASTSKGGMFGLH